LGLNENTSAPQHPARAGQCAARCFRTHCIPVSCSLGVLASPGKRLMRRAAATLGATLPDNPGFGALALRVQADTGRCMHHRPIAYRFYACTKWSGRQRHRGTAGPCTLGLNENTSAPQHPARAGQSAARCFRTHCTPVSCNMSASAAPGKRLTAAMQCNGRVGNVIVHNEQGGSGC